MPITATFSNGFTDTYKGRRDVRAAWMITHRQTGEVLMSGHSLDADRAQKTAEGNVSGYCLVDPGMWQIEVPRKLYLGVSYNHVFKRAESEGFEGRRGNWDALRRFAKAHNAARKAKILSMVNIEVIEL